MSLITKSRHDIHDDTVLIIVTGPAAWIGLRDARSGSSEETKL